MRTVPSAIAAHRARREHVHAEVLVWVQARNRDSGAIEAMGLWTGVDHQTFTIRGQARTYYGAGNVLQVPEIEAATGIEVRSYNVGLSAISPEVEQLLRGYDPRLQRCELHRAEFDPDGNLLAEPERILKGSVDGDPITTPSVGGVASATLTVVSSARMLTRRPGVTKSDEVQRRRSGDRFRIYGSIAGKVPVNWGAR